MKDIKFYNILNKFYSLEYSKYVPSEYSHFWWEAFMRETIIRAFIGGFTVYVKSVSTKCACSSVFLFGNSWKPLVFLCFEGVQNRKIGHRRVNFEWNINYYKKPIFSFYTPWKHQETRNLLVLSEGITGNTSSIVNEVIRTISIFFKKNFSNTKTRHKQKTTNKTKISEQKTAKATILRIQKLLRGPKILYSLFFLFKSLLQKIKIVFITTFTILLMFPSSTQLQNIYLH